MSDYSELKRLAEAAIRQGDESGQRWPQGEDWFEPELISAEMDYVKAASPATVLALAADLESLRTNHEHVIALNHKQFGDAIRKNAECDQLKAENEALREDLEHAKRQPLYSTRLAADRYRWLRQQTWDASPIAVVLNPKAAVKLGYGCPSGLLLDHAIDLMRLESASD